jgi:hypothetical protein
MKHRFKRKQNAKDFSTYQLLDYATSDICALTEEEYLTKYDECMVQVFQNKPEELDKHFNNWLGEDWKEHFDGPFPSGPAHLEINGYSNYKELLDESKFYADFISKRAFDKELGRLHRSGARISILLSITAAEDFANLQCSKNLKLTKNQIGRKSLRNKWQLLVPDFETKFPEFKDFLKLRNESIIHFKNSSKLEIKHIIDLNYKNASALNELIIEMILAYKNKMRDGFDVVDPNSFMNFFGQHFEILQDWINGMLEQQKNKKDSPKGNE